MKKGIENIMQVGFGFGALLERFLIDSGPKLGAKLDQVGIKSWKKQYKNNIENIIKILKFFVDFIDFQRQRWKQEPGTAAGGGSPIEEVCDGKFTLDDRQHASHGVLAWHSPWDVFWLFFDCFLSVFLTFFNCF